MNGRIQVLVCGRVQGVFFRQNAKELASELGLRGYARNLEDGSVEIVAEGSQQKLDKIIEFCKKGPNGASVESTKITYDECKNEFEDFEIRQ